jgi:hypothetical protein
VPPPFPPSSLAGAQSAPPSKWAGSLRPVRLGFASGASFSDARCRSDAAPWRVVGKPGVAVKITLVASGAHAHASAASRGSSPTVPSSELVMIVVRAPLARSSRASCGTSRSGRVRL